MSEFTWPASYVFECHCGERYHRGDIVTKSCCLRAMDETPTLNVIEWAAADPSVARWLVPANPNAEQR